MYPNVFRTVNTPIYVPALHEHSTVLGSLIDHTCAVYLDDILVIGATEEEQLQNLKKKKLKRLRDAGFRLNHEE